MDAPASARQRCVLEEHETAAPGWEIPQRAAAAFPGRLDLKLAPDFDLQLFFPRLPISASRRKMRMKFNKSRQLALVSAASLVVASLVTACSQFTQTLTVDFVYVASAAAAGPNQYGEIDVFEINSESGGHAPDSCFAVPLGRPRSRC